MNNWLIRRANENDSEGLSQCMKDAYSQYIERMEGKILPPMEVDYKEEISTYPVWVAEYENEIVGGFIMMFETSYAQIANIAVRSDMQGKGLGKEMMNFSEEVSRLRGYREMQLATHVLLTENVEYYKHLGWVEIDRDDSRVYMKKNI